jgi:hypothetical protein
VVRSPFITILTPHATPRMGRLSYLPSEGTMSLILNHEK